MVLKIYPSFYVGFGLSPTVIVGVQLYITQQEELLRIGKKGAEAPGGLCLLFLILQGPQLFLHDFIREVGGTGHAAHFNKGVAKATKPHEDSVAMYKQQSGVPVPEEIVHLPS